MSNAACHGLTLLILTGSPVFAGNEPPTSAPPSRAGTAEDRLKQLEELMAQREARIESLRAQLESDGVNTSETARTDEIRRVVRELLSDADFRQSLYPDIVQVGYEDGFYIRDTDRSFDLVISGMMQVRWIGQNRQTDDRRFEGRNRQDDLNGFEVQYMELNFDGHLHDPRLMYHIAVIGDTDQANSWQSYYAQIMYELATEFTINAGILDLPQGFNYLVADNKQLFVDRSLAEETLSLGKSIGVAASGLLLKRLEYAMGIFNGVANDTDTPDMCDTNFAYAASMICHLLGDGVGDDETDLEYSKDPKWDIGTSFAFNDDNGDFSTTSVYAIPERIRRGRGIGGYADADLTGTQLIQFGAHTALRYRGFSLTAEWYCRTIDGENQWSPWELQTGRSGSMHFQGGYIEAAYFVVPKKIELAARLGGIWDVGADNTWEYSFGANYYPFESHNFKLQFDFTRIEEASVTSAYGTCFQNDEINMFRVCLQAGF